MACRLLPYQYARWSMYLEEAHASLHFYCFSVMLDAWFPYCCSGMYDHDLCDASRFATGNNVDCCEFVFSKASPWLLHSVSVVAVARNRVRMILDIYILGDLMLRCGDRPTQWVGCGRFITRRDEIVSAASSISLATSIHSHDPRLPGFNWHRWSIFIHE